MNNAFIAQQIMFPIQILAAIVGAYILHEWWRHGGDDDFHDPDCPV